MSGAYGTPRSVTDNDRDSGADSDHDSDAQGESVASTEHSDGDRQAMDASTLSDAPQ